MLKWNQNNKMKMMYIKKKFVVSTTKYLQLFLPSQNCVSKNESFFLELPSLGNPKSHRHDSKQTRIQNSNP